MYERLLRRFREKIRLLKYIVTLHADEEMAMDQLTIFDFENLVLTGRIINRQRDRLTGEWKYLI